MSVPEQNSPDPFDADPLADPGASGPLGGDPLASGAPLGGPAPAQPQPQQSRTQKPRTNVYTMMLILSFAAIVTACILLWLRLDQYGSYPWWEVPADLTR